MSKLSRITISISHEDQKILNKVVKNLNLSSPGQLVRILCSGNADQINLISNGFKDVHKLF